MSKKPNKNKRVQQIPVNWYRKVALISNPIICVVLIALLFFGLPWEAVVGIGVVCYAVWAYFFIQANRMDYKIHSNKKRR